MNPEKFSQPSPENQESSEKKKETQEQATKPAEVTNELGWLSTEDNAERRYKDEQKLKELRGQLGIKAKAEKGIETKKQSEEIFENVYNQLKQPSASATPERQAELFLSGLADGAQRHIDDIESKGVTNQQIYQEMWQKMAEYISRYQNDPRFEKKKEDVSKLYTRLTEHVNKIVKQGEVEPRTAKVFLRSLLSLKYIGDYNAITRNNENIPPEELKAKNQDYVRVTDEMWEKQPEGMKQEQSGGFYHFNSHLEGDVKNRIYISAQLSGSPEKVIEAWQAALQETGLQNKVYFKLPTGLSKRFESIILYQTDKTNEADIEKLLTVFNQKCPTELLNDKDMPTGIPLRRGISMAPEPANINTLIRYSGSQENISYNQLIASLTELSFELAYKDAQKTGQANPMPKILKDNAGKYFEQMIRLSGINPDTMVPNSQGGKLPAWAERISGNIEN